jgi:hypothetical protein
MSHRGLVATYAQPAAGAETRLEGPRSATTAERDGRGAEDVVGHRLVLAANRFEIRSGDGKRLYGRTLYRGG